MNGTPIPRRRTRAAAGRCAHRRFFFTAADEAEPSAYDGHLDRLRRGLDRTTSDPIRDQRWQQSLRTLELDIRTEAVTLYNQFCTDGMRAAEAASLIGRPSRTLRQWQHDLETIAEPLPLGRPHVRCSSADADRVICFLHAYGPGNGIPALRGEFPDVPRAELEDLLACHRHLWIAAHPREIFELTWHRPGSVWGMDFTKPPRPIDGLYPYILNVRDLGSGRQLAWLPVPDERAETVRAELTVLFTILGAPLILKSDNGSAFRAMLTKNFLERWQVWPLYSPPSCPWYNGSVEAANGSLKTRTKFEAWRNGHAGEWTSADLEQAREIANTTARPRGPKAPTPQEAWDARQAPTQSERERFGTRFRTLEADARRSNDIPLEKKLKHYEEAELHRPVLTSVLVEGGYLSMRRRLIPQKVTSQKTAII